MRAEGVRALGRETKRRKGVKVLERKDEKLKDLFRIALYDLTPNEKKV